MDGVRQPLEKVGLMSSFHHHLTRIGFLLIACCPLAVATAAPIKPFDAEVRAGAGEDAYVRSGPGMEHHYPTLKLSPGDKVHVLRKDPGGWYMIDPPAGSFSWIIAKYVQRNGKQGTVNETGVVVRVGAFNSTQRDVEQVRLNKGDLVEIIGEETLISEKGKELWLKIKPPRGEHRWIKGSHLVELNPDGTPKVLPPKSTTRKPIEPPDDGESPAVAVVPPAPSAKSKGPGILRDPDFDGEDAPLFGHAPGKKRPSVDPFSEEPEEPSTAQSEEAAIREDLTLLDHELKQILVKSPKDWDLSHQLEDLQALKEMSGNSPLTAEIDRRLTKVKTYQQLHEDAQYMARKYNPSAPAGPGNGSDGSRREFSMPNVNRPPEAGVPNDPRVTTSRPGQPTPPGQRYEGAGIVHRLPNAPPGTPRYVIAAPDRRILCYLDTDPGIDLEKYLGQSVGLNGPRAYDPRLRADRMRVQKLTRVILAR